MTFLVTTILERYLDEYIAAPPSCLPCRNSTGLSAGHSRLGFRPSSD